MDSIESLTADAHLDDHVIWTSVPFDRTSFGFIVELAVPDNEENQISDDDIITVAEMLHEMLLSLKGIREVSPVFITSAKRSTFSIKWFNEMSASKLQTWLNAGIVVEPEMSVRDAFNLLERLNRFMDKITKNIMFILDFGILWTDFSKFEKFSSNDLHITMLNIYDGRIKKDSPSFRRISDLISNILGRPAVPDEIIKENTRRMEKKTTNSFKTMHLSCSGRPVSPI